MIFTKNNNVLICIFSFQVKLELACKSMKRHLAASSKIISTYSYSSSALYTIVIRWIIFIKTHWNKKSKKKALLYLNNAKIHGFRRLVEFTSGFGGGIDF